jgi:hypothetical protein
MLPRSKEIAMPSFTQPSGAFTIYDRAYTRVLPDVSSPSRAAAVNFEEVIRFDAVESGRFIAPNGSVLLTRIGQPNRIAFSLFEMMSMRQTLFTHNHPNGTSFSIDDVMMASAIGLAELRVVTSFCRYIMLPAQNWPDELIIGSVYDRESVQCKRDVTTMVNTGTLAAQYATLEVHHLAWVRAAVRLGLKYHREAS